MPPRSSDAAAVARRPRATQAAAQRGWPPPPFLSSTSSLRSNSSPPMEVPAARVAREAAEAYVRDCHAHFHRIFAAATANATINATGTEEEIFGAVCKLFASLSDY
ncbi:hypothetical protein E2562_018765 [Oryza meyeriana var. granulata]|uniref:Uncharacterized protein n=1 Tax=Oryza meyeriana var. granulata TaxID=110450 RepID=A0A6G1EX85_9ORYZ|nr:hypothetical protein E2562_018765 [Oryza meyeriana var. granulata]